jgi:hypothetical protein
LSDSCKLHSLRQTMGTIRHVAPPLHIHTPERTLHVSVSAQRCVHSRLWLRGGSQCRTRLTLFISYVLAVAGIVTGVAQLLGMKASQAGDDGGGTGAGDGDSPVPSDDAQLWIGAVSELTMLDCVCTPCRLHMSRN